METIFIICIPSCFLVGFLLGYLERKRRTLRHIRELTKDLDEIMRGEFKSLDKTIKEGEISQLYSQINTLCRRLQRLIQRLEEEKKEVKDYLVDVSHQLKTPVTAMSTYLQIMEKEEEDGDKLRQISRCIQLTDKVNHLIGNILKLARLEADAVPFEVEEVSLHDTVQQVFQMIRRDCGEKDVVLINRVKEGDGIRYDESWFMEALFNIIKNGILYGGDHPRIEVEGRGYEHVYEIRIRDNGPGINRESLPYIFDRFHRGGRTGEEDAQGTGLGLAIAKAIIEKMHGRIEAESGEKGTVFTIYLSMLVTGSRIERTLP